MRKLYYIAIEGPIGVGKTSLANLLSKELGARLVLEDFEDNPFLRAIPGGGGTSSGVLDRHHWHCLTNFQTKLQNPSHPGMKCFRVGIYCCCFLYHGFKLVF